MNLRNAVAGLLLTTFVAGVAPAPTTYQLDPEHTFMTFTVARFGMVRVTGFFPDVTGTIAFDADDPAAIAADITVQTTSVYSGKSDGRDQAIRGNMFLDVENFPTITFKTTQVVKAGDGYAATGDLTIKGTTKEVTFPLTIQAPFVDPTGTTTIAVHGELTVDRRDFGIFPVDRVLDNGAPMIGTDVDITFDALATPAG